MRAFVSIFATFAVIALGYWAYVENYKTQAALDEVEALQEDIGAMRERVMVLKAEWAYLNRPDRLRDLVELNYDRLGLFPLEAQQFGRVDEIAYPDEDDSFPFIDNGSAVDVRGRLSDTPDDEAAQ